MDFVYTKVTVKDVMAFILDLHGLLETHHFHCQVAVIVCACEFDFLFMSHYKCLRYSCLCCNCRSLHKICKSTYYKSTFY